MSTHKHLVSNPRPAVPVSALETDMVGNALHELNALAQSLA